MSTSASEIHEHTLAGPAIIAGVGVHTGRRTRLSIRPAASGHGIVFVRTDIKDRDNHVPVSAEAVVKTQLGTVIANAAGVEVSTIEHLMSAFCILGVDNAVVELDGPEVPIMDGSALPFVQLLDRAGFRRQEAPQRYIEVLEPISVDEGGGKTATLLPCDRFEMFFEIEFPGTPIGTQSVDVVMDEDAENLEPIQRSVESAAHGGIPLNYQERRIWHLHATIDRSIIAGAGADAIPEHLRVPDLLADWVDTSS